MALPEYFQALKAYFSAGDSSKLIHGGLSERPMELVLKTSEQQCFVGSNPTASASFRQCCP